MAAPKKGVAFTFDIVLIDQASRPNIKVTPTLAAGDFKVSIDGAATANPATLPSESPASSGIVKVVLSAAEMAGDRIAVKAHDAAGAEWDDLLVDIFPTLVAVDDGALAAGTAQSVTASTIVLASGDGAKVPGNSIVTVLSATTGAGQSRYVASVATDTATIDPNWTVTPTGTIVYMVQAAPPSTAAVTAQLAHLDTDISGTAALLLDLAAGVETSLTVRQYLRLAAAAMLGKSSGHPGSPVYRDTNDTKNRITATTDASGNRTVVTKDAS